jgi:chemotaxis protein methyltransferase CheR
LAPLFQTQETVKIWHAGCASGEEVFSMAILLKENGWLERTKIFASDIDKAILTKAKEGHFRLKNMQLNSQNYLTQGGKAQLADYYSQKEDSAQMDKNLLSNANFIEHDLASGRSFAKVDVVMCRNVLILF